MEKSNFTLTKIEFITGVYLLLLLYTLLLLKQILTNTT